MVINVVLLHTFYANFSAYTLLSKYSRVMIYFLETS